MRFLLDTQVFFWVVHLEHTVPSTLASSLERARAIWVSDVSAFEVSLKVNLGKFSGASELVDSWSEALAGVAARALPLNTAHALRAGALDWDHGDPFDRMIVAQAQVEGLTLVTSDRAIRSMPNLDVLPW